MRNWTEGTIWTGDNLDVMRGMNSDSVDMIYLDPPFNSGTIYVAAAESRSTGATFRDTWTVDHVDDSWMDDIASEHPMLHRVMLAVMTKNDRSYLSYMAIRLLEMRRILKPSGSIYLHCDTTMSHYLKLVMDAIFGRDNFRNDISWKRTYGTRAGDRRFSRVHDSILFYAASEDVRIRPTYIPYEDEYVETSYRFTDSRGVYAPMSLTATTFVRHGSSGKPWRGIEVSPRGLCWAVPTAVPDDVVLPDDWKSRSSQDRLDWLDDHDLIHWPKKGKMPCFKRYLSTVEGKRTTDMMTDIPPVMAGSRDRTGYPTQKPVALIERFIKTGTDKGDLVLDPFCGSATTCIAAHSLDRKWTGIDLSENAAKVAGNRFSETFGLTVPNVIHRTDVPVRTD